MLCSTVYLSCHHLSFARRTVLQSMDMIGENFVRVSPIREDKPKFCFAAGYERELSGQTFNFQIGEGIGDQTSTPLWGRQTWNSALFHVTKPEFHCAPPDSTVFPSVFWALFVYIHKTMLSFLFWPHQNIWWVSPQRALFSTWALFWTWNFASRGWSFSFSQWGKYCVIQVN